MNNTNVDTNILVGIDYGNANIGLALGKNGLVQPLRVISAKNIESAIHEITRIALESKASKFVIGLPLDSKGKETFQSQEVRKFGKKLKLVSKKPIIYLDEHYSSKEALKESISLGISRKKRKSNDHIAAAIILRRYFEEKDIKYNKNLSK